MFTGFIEGDEPLISLSENLNYILYICIKHIKNDIILEKVKLLFYV